MKNPNLGKMKENRRKISTKLLISRRNVPKMRSKSDHVINVTKKGKTVVNYFVCPRFAEMQPRGGLNELKNKGLCFQCLNPGLKKASR